MATTWGFSGKLGRLEGHKHYIYVQKRRTELGRRKILVKCQVPHVAKIINSSSFGRNYIIYLEKLPHSHQAPTGEAGRVIAPTRREQPLFYHFSAMCCILGLPLMQAGARHYQWLSGKLADNEFSSENRADIFQFSVWTKSREHFIWKELLPSWGLS